MPQTQLWASRCCKKNPDASLNATSSHSSVDIHSSVCHWKVPGLSRSFQGSQSYSYRADNLCYCRHRRTIHADTWFLIHSISLIWPFCAIHYTHVSLRFVYSIISGGLARCVVPYDRLCIMQIILGSLLVQARMLRHDYYQLGRLQIVL